MKNFVMTITTTSSLVLLLALYTISSLPLTLSRVFLPIDANENIDQTCKQTPYYNTCVSNLRSDPRSSHADVKGLALIMVDVLGAKAKETMSHIKDLIKKTSKRDEKKALYSCADYYNIGIITDDVPVAIEALTKGNYKFAEEGANDAANEANSCENSFKGNSPLTHMNKLVHDVAAVAAAITRLLL